MNAEELDSLRRQLRQWEIEHINAALRDAGSGRLVGCSKLGEMLGVELCILDTADEAKIKWAEAFVTHQRALFDYMRQCSGGWPPEQYLERLVATVEFLSEHSHLGYPGRVLGTREWGPAIPLPIVVYRIFRGELQILGSFQGSPKGRTRMTPARA